MYPGAIYRIAQCALLKIDTTTAHHPRILYAGLWERSTYIIHLVTGKNS